VHQRRAPALELRRPTKSRERKIGWAVAALTPTGPFPSLLPLAEGSHSYKR
jgi:hypothetical protein